LDVNGPLPALHSGATAVYRRVTIRNIAVNSTAIYRECAPRGRIDGGVAMTTGATQRQQSLAITITNRDLWLIRAALQEYLAIFSHTEAEVVHEVKGLLDSLPKVVDDESNINEVFPQGQRVTL
jgi:hypothetical protein